MKKSSTILIIGLMATSCVLLTSCSLGGPQPPKEEDMKTRINKYIQSGGSGSHRGGDRGRRFGSGAMLNGSGSMRGSGMLNDKLKNLSEEDKKLFDQMRQARQNGDSKTEETIRNQLKTKYPDMFSFTGGMNRGSGSTRPPEEGMNGGPEGGPNQGGGN
ncbi:MAG: hypothetical protein PHF46_02370 [Candidatus Gracilibacteria bacterium]|nr:hypothetical protein [Candidatus Gracilibacteria bacterium]MDD3120227.1 hypothetical protein [Candidatus Gracilibacteria bacterium]MDD4530601.1 hypothetical protein [Candidatus Gracilibacteria bacterium]